MGDLLNQGDFILTYVAASPASLLNLYRWIRILDGSRWLSDHPSLHFLMF